MVQCRSQNRVFESAKMLPKVYVTINVLTPFCNQYSPNMELSTPCPPKGGLNFNPNGGSTVPLGVELLLEQGKGALLNGVSHRFHKGHEVVDVMDGVQAVGQEFFRHKKMTQVGP
jgi:hypothetical protein